MAAIITGESTAGIAKATASIAHIMMLILLMAEVMILNAAACLADTGANTIPATVTKAETGGIARLTKHHHGSATRTKTADVD